MLKKFVSKEPVLKGWSGDKKYCLTDEQGNRFLLRVTPIEKYDEKMKEYELMHRVAELGVPMCDPLEFGTCDKGVYSIQTWIDGEDAKLPRRKAIRIRYGRRTFSPQNSLHPCTRNPGGLGSPIQPQDSQENSLI